MKYNGWTNWDTWEAYNILSSYENVYNRATIHPTEKKLKALLEQAYSQMATSSIGDHLDLNKVNFDEMIDSLTGNIEY